ncbi:MAG TPA: dienelactone hydrolase family protein [Gemmata sp.]|jgi:predicted peptidase|nr:dienelactone hydrolase family protein [Gemmata sp.]
MTRVAGIFAFFFLPTVCLAAGKPATGFVDKSFLNADCSRSPYVVFVPRDYDGTKEYPVILFLHGSGETKGGSKMPVEVGIGPAIRARENTFPFITVFPQSENRTWRAASQDGYRAMAILDEVMKEYKTDPRRVYLTGLSMGGSGTWSLAAEYPYRWAAIAPVCGRAKLTDAAKINAIPCWCFHGEADLAVPVRNSREMIEALKNFGAAPKYTEYPKVGHNSWDMAYGTNELYTWFLEQKNFRTPLADTTCLPVTCGSISDRVIPCEGIRRFIFFRRAGCR